VIVVEDSGFFKKKTEKLADYLAELPDYLVLIFSESEVDKRNRLFKAAGKNGRTVVFETQTEEMLTRWVLQRLAKEAKKITRADMQHFLEVTGTDMANINSELEKLLSYTLERDVITKEDIDAVCAPQISNKIFDMVRAVVGHSQKEALDYYYDLLALKEPPMRTLYLISLEYNRLLMVKELAEAGAGDAEIAKKAGMPPFAVRRTKSLAARYEKKQLRKILELCVGADEDIKSGRMSDRLAVELLLVQLS
jgi:DNA polymerase-3 subunit delta